MSTIPDMSIPLDMSIVWDISTRSDISTLSIMLISPSGIGGGAGAIGLFCRVCRLRLDMADLLVLADLDSAGGRALAGAIGFGGPGAMFTTPAVLELGNGGFDDVVDFGDSDSGARC